MSPEAIVEISPAPGHCCRRAGSAADSGRGARRHRVGRDRRGARDVPLGRRADPAARRVAAAARGATPLRRSPPQFDAERDPPDLERVRDTLAAALDKARPARSRALEAAAHHLERTGAHRPDRHPDAWRWTSSGSIGVDLRNGRIDARASLVANPPPDGWSGPLPQAGSHLANRTHGDWSATSMSPRSRTS